MIPFKEEVIAENYPNLEHQRESNSYGTNEFVFMSNTSPNYQNVTDSLGSNQPPTFSHYQNLLGNRLEPVTAGRCPKIQKDYDHMYCKATHTYLI